jgi:acetylornithine deacetylase/succinyl-diaminopimelate desuccinylase-like protein
VDAVAPSKTCLRASFGTVVAIPSELSLDLLDEDARGIGFPLNYPPMRSRQLDLVARRLRKVLGARPVTVLAPAGTDGLPFAAAVVPAS